MGKIVLITDSLADPRIAKRYNSLQSKGYCTELFVFSRNKKFRNDNDIPYRVIGDISNLSYFKRLQVLYRGVKTVVKKYSSEKDAVFYIFGLQIALIYKFIGTNPYIYEEADLVHTYIKISLGRKLFEYLDKMIITKSILSIFTSEGFIQYHFKITTPKNTNYLILPNRLSPKIKSFQSKEKSHCYNPEKINFGFVGGVRFESTIFFIEHVVKNYPQHRFHIFGIVDAKYKERIQELNKFDNLLYHGTFKNPDDLPQIYSSIDYVLSTYDNRFVNVRYAEPNKLYESIYFRVPIIVSENTFLANQIKKLNSGLAVNALNHKEIDNLLNSLTLEKYNNLISSLSSIDRSYAVDSDDEFAERVNNIIPRI